MGNCSYKQALREFQKVYFLGLLTANKWSMTAVASEAGMDRAYLYKLIGGLGISSRYIVARQRAKAMKPRTRDWPFPPPMIS